MAALTPANRGGCPDRTPLQRPMPAGPRRLSGGILRANMPRGPHSTSLSACPASRSTSATTRRRPARTSAALPVPPAMSSSMAPGQAPRPRRSTPRSPRIPAQRVIRVEVGPGDLYGSDYAGKSQVLERRPVAGSGHRREGHRVGEAPVHRLREHRHPGLGARSAAALRQSICRPAQAAIASSRKGRIP